jgi:hypothetical protein
MPRFFPLVLVVLCGVTRAEEVRLVATADVWVSSFPRERLYNVGAGRQLKLKSYQEMSIVRFDVSGLRGRRIVGGRLYLKEASEKNALRKIGLSTVAADWVEGSGKSYTVDKAGHGASFLWASHDRARWAWPGSDLSDVTMGNGHTLQHHTERVRTQDGWFYVEVPGYLIQALVAGASDGLLVMDDSGQTAANNYVFSRHVEGAEPYLLVRVGGAEAQAPRAPRLALHSAPGRATISTGAAELSVLVRRDAFAYDVRLNGRPVERWRIPFAPGVGEPVVFGGRKIPPMARVEDGWQKIVLEDLPSAAKLTVAVRAVSAAGVPGEWAEVAGRSGAALERPRPLRPKPAERASGEPPVRSNAMRVWAFPEAMKIDPTGGRIPRSLRRANPVWSGRTGTVHLSAARGEIVACQLCIEATGGTLEGVRVVPSSLLPVGGGRTPVDRRHAELYRVWYVRAGGRVAGRVRHPAPARRGPRHPVAEEQHRGADEPGDRRRRLRAQGYGAGRIRGDVDRLGQGCSPRQAPRPADGARPRAAGRDELLRRPELLRPAGEVGERAVQGIAQACPRAPLCHRPGPVQPRRPHAP